LYPLSLSLYLKTLCCSSLYVAAAAFMWTDVYVLFFAMQITN
jgi:hypothetical protein